jgi:hypothetical protein
MNAPSIKFTPTADASAVSKHSRSIIRAALLRSDNASCTITSTTRTPARQALAMLKNIESTSVADQLNLYGPAGRAVIREYERLNSQDHDQKTILSAMEAKINEIGPSKVSRHCADPSNLNVIDIAPSSIAQPGKFMAALEDAKLNGSISRFFSPANHDPAFHLEIPQPAVK